MRLVADRFLTHDDGRVFDLVTGDRIVLRVDAAGDTAEQARWSVRCDALQKVHHCAVARLIDFGQLGTTQRFEAWQCVPQWNGSGAEAERTHELASRFLRAVGLSGPTGTAVESVCEGISGAVMLPDASTGYPRERDEDEAARLELGARGLATIPRQPAIVLGEVVSGHPGVRPHVVALWGPSGSGKTALALEIARLARAHGFVPVAARFVTTAYAGLFQGRQLLILDDEEDATGMRALLHAALGTPQPHVLILASRDEPRSVDAIAMDRIAASRLMAAIEPAVTDARMHAHVQRAADEARGIIGRFVRSIWPQGRATQPCARGLPRVAERPATYDSRERLDELTWGSTPHPSSVARGDPGAPLRSLVPLPSQDDAEPVEASTGRRVAGAPCAPSVEPRPGLVWPAPGDLAALRHRMDAAIKDLQRGRHERGTRLLRQSIGGLARRDDWMNAGHGVLALASALLRRGRVREALAALEQARQLAIRSGVEQTLIDCAILSGEALIDSARLDEAESVLGAAVAAARRSGDAIRIASARIALARSGFWRGRYAEAGAILADQGETAQWPSVLRLRHTLLSAKVAVGQAEFSEAMALAGDSLQQAAADPSLQAAAWSAAAFVHLAVGDLDAVERDGAAAIRGARMSHDPLRAVRARILVAEAARRRGRTHASLVQMKRLAGAKLPATIRLRCELIASMAASSAGDLALVVDRHLSGSGLRALELYTPDAARSDTAFACDPNIDHLVAIVHLCQTAEDDLAILKNVCGRVRQQLHALGVSFFCALNRGCEFLAGEGARIEQDIALRTLAVGTGVRPHQIEDRLEAAAPVRYGGVTIAALCARWAPGSMYDRSRALTVLTVAAAAAAPIVSAAGARRRRDVATMAFDLRGVTPAMSELRQAIERAAAAPFSVLVTGESGSGKELVARAIHRAGPRRERPFCTLNCAALPDDLIEAELFGHARGAFTGAVADRAGVFEEAHGGIVFLDEVGELSLRAQAKVLRVIQEGELRRVGENASRRVDVRIVSATNRDLAHEVAAGRFRLDLLYRLDVVRIAVPPLRERREDIAVLAEYFWQEATARIASRATLSAATIAALARYDWPGNVRELQNVLAALAVRSPKRGVVPPTALPPQFGIGPSADRWRLDEARRTFEEQFVRAALVRSGGRRSRAAEELGVTRQGLTKLMTRLGIGDG
jgi:DNA-binding NtrC family response regulator/tetratricopeptide (TPR) repeat protein